MNAKPEQPGVLERSTTVRLARWLCRWRNLRKLILAVACLATFVALVYAVIDWRGRHAWRQYEKQMSAQGKPLDLGAFIAQPVPDDQNFAMTPFLKPLFDFKPGTQQWRDTNAAQRTLDFAKDLPVYQQAGWAIGEPESLVPLEEASRRPSSTTPAPAATGEAKDRKQAAAVVLEKLAKYDPVLEELRAASHRPYCRFNLVYGDFYGNDPGNIVRKHFNLIKRIVTVLTLRASAELAVGHTDAALSDIQLTLYVADCLKHEPTLISGLVRLAALRAAVQPIWEGLEARQWSDAQLRTLQQRLATFDLLADLEFELGGERACGNLYIQLLRRDPQQFARVLAPPGTAPPQGFSPMALFPSGWFYWEQLHYNQAFDQFLLTGVNAAAGRVYPDKLARADATLGDLRRDKWQVLVHHRLMTAVLLPAMMGIHARFAYVQTCLDEARLACALERYRQANGRLPANLGALVPRVIEKLPHDVITGQPLKYQPTADGRFALYSVGWNMKDDGGKAVLRRSLTPSVDIRKGDWVWRCPALR
jgi:hypothetical protein